MNKVMLLVILTLATFSTQAATLTIGLDLSGSSPIFNDSFAPAAGSEAGAHVAALALGDKVSVRTFGSRDLANLRSSSLQISRSQRPRAAAAIIASQIAALPNSGVTPQGSTNILAFLEFGDFDCQNGGQILLITDGLEASSYANPELFLKGKAQLPEPSTPFLSGCTLTFYGLGAEHPPQAAKHMRDAWRAWSEKAGAVFLAIIP